MRITDEYVMEKIEAHNVAISALEAHEPGGDCDNEMAWRLRKKLAAELDHEIQRWCDKYMQGKKNESTR